MSEHTDIVDLLLAHQRVPAMDPALVDRIVAEAGRPATARRTSPPPRRRTRGWTKRSVWTVAIALNLVLASAVAAAIGGARFVPATIVAATHSVIERLRPHGPALRHAPVQHHRVEARARTITALTIHHPFVMPQRAAPPLIGRPVAQPFVRIAPAIRHHRMTAPRPTWRPLRPARLAHVRPQRRRDRAGSDSPMHQRPANRPNQAAGPGFRHGSADAMPPKWRSPAWRDEAPWRHPGWQRDRPWRDRGLGPRGGRRGGGLRSPGRRRF